ncbi:JAB domain-containing protein [Macrococcoides caseolyticum]|uniref:JAB domain-containing protein n=1 Tax=Macrococcoides caseolyticum TaxID=69966 RepID=UPI0018E399A0|nr:JAB domain-containing protein [Macrococcus caseolyticus]
MRKPNFNGNMIYEITELKQYYKKRKEERFTINSPLKIQEFLRSWIGNRTSEHFVMLGLNTKNEVIVCYEVFKGTVNSSIIHPREAFCTAIINNCSSVVFCHNHPSSTSDFSIPDVETAKRLQEVGNIIGIEMLDFCVVTDEEFSSLREKGVINQPKFFIYTGVNNTCIYNTI